MDVLKGSTAIAHGSQNQIIDQVKLVRFYSSQVEAIKIFCIKREPPIYSQQPKPTITYLYKWKFSLSFNSFLSWIVNYDRNFKIKVLN